MPDVCITVWVTKYWLVILLEYLSVFQGSQYKVFVCNPAYSSLEIQKTKMSHVTFREDVYVTINFSSTRNTQFVRTSKWKKKFAPSCAAHIKTNFLLIFLQNSVNLGESQSARRYEVRVLRLHPPHSGRILPTFRGKEFHSFHSLKI